MKANIFARELRAPEGPTVGPDGWILNVCSLDVPDVTWPTRPGDITATHTSRPRVTHTVFNTSTDDVVGIPAALAFGPDGCLYVTDEGRRAIVRVTPQGEKHDFIAEFEGARLNGPNDLCFDADGNLFFTDPWGSSAEHPIGAVYGYRWATGKLSQIHSARAFPNGILVRDGRVLAAETGTNMIWHYEVTAAGCAEHPEVFCVLPERRTAGLGGPDGMAYDEAGNVFVAAYGAGAVYVYDESGDLLERIAVGGERPTNVCFGGPAHDTLYVTVDDLGAIVEIPVGTRGYTLPFCPSAAPGHPWARMLPSPPAQ